MQMLAETFPASCDPVLDIPSLCSLCLVYSFKVIYNLYYLVFVILFFAPHFNFYMFSFPLDYKHFDFNIFLYSSNFLGRAWTYSGDGG